MNIAIALAQFIMLALGVMAARILVNSGAIDVPPAGWADQFAVFAANQGVWFLLIPALWLIFAEWFAKSNSPLAKSAQGLGVGITVAILAGIVVVLVF
jgi:hypothetical protein